MPENNKIDRIYAEVMNKNPNALTKEDIESIVKATEESTPEEVIKMRESIENADAIKDESDDGYEYTEELKDISLDSSYQELLGSDIEGLPITSANIFKVAGGLDIKDEDVEEKMKENASQLFDLSDEELIEFTGLLSRYRKGEAEKNGKTVFSQLPANVRNTISSMAASEGILPTQYNKMAKVFLDEFISEAAVDEAFVDFERSINEALKIPSILDMYSEHTKMVMDEKIPEMIEKIKDTEPENAQLLEDIRSKFYLAYSLDALKDHYEEFARTRKLIRRDWEDPIRFCDEFNLKNDKSSFKMPDCRSIGPALVKVFQTEVEPDSRIDKMNVSTEDLNKFVVLFCRHIMNMDPDNILEAAYMYYSLRNITMLNLTNETKTEFAAQLINNICDIIEFIRDKEAEFNASNTQSQKRKSKKNVR